MRIPESRFGASGGSSGLRRFLTVLLVAIGASGVVAGTVFLVRARTPLMAIRQTERPQTAIGLWREGRYDQVVTVTTEQLSAFPLDPTALSLRGFARFYLSLDAVDTDRRRELLVGSIRDLRRALLVPEPELLGEIRYILGKAYFHRGEFFYDAAVVQLEAARAAGIERLDLLEYLALASRDLLRFERAEEYFRAAIELGDEAIHRITLATMLIEQGRFLDADDLLLEAVEDTDDATLLQDALLTLGRSYRAQERYEDAIGVYRDILEINPSSAEAHYGTGEVYLALGEQDQARFEWREAIRLDPNHIESLQRLQEY